MLLNSFNVDRTFTWPPRGLTLHWWKLGRPQRRRPRRAAGQRRGGARSRRSIALRARHAGRRWRCGGTRFFGRNAVSLLIILPIALPGIVTGIALNNAFRTMLGIELGFLTIVVAHATFCIVTVFNNVQARLQRLGADLEQASADLGAGPFTTFRLVTFPMLRSALLAGALLAFGLSFDEIVVTTFTAGPQVQTLPLWIFQNLFRPNQAPVVNVVAAVLVLVSAVPIYLAQRLSGDTVSTPRRLPDRVGRRAASAERVGEQAQGLLAGRGPVGRRAGERAGDRVQHHLVDVVRRGELGAPARRPRPACRPPSARASARRAPRCCSGRPRSSASSTRRLRR